MSIPGHKGASKYHNFGQADLDFQKAVIVEQLKKREQYIAKLQSILHHKNETQKMNHTVMSPTAKVEMESGISLSSLRLNHMSVKAIPKNNPYK